MPCMSWHGLPTPATGYHHNFFRCGAWTCGPNLRLCCASVYVQCTVVALCQSLVHKCCCPQQVQRSRAWGSSQRDFCASSTKKLTEQEAGGYLRRVTVSLLPQRGSACKRQLYDERWQDKSRAALSASQEPGCSLSFCRLLVPWTRCALTPRLERKHTWEERAPLRTWRTHSTHLERGRALQEAPLWPWMRPQGTPGTMHQRGQSLRNCEAVQWPHQRTPRAARRPARGTGTHGWEGRQTLHQDCSGMAPSMLLQGLGEQVNVGPLRGQWFGQSWQGVSHDVSLGLATPQAGRPRSTTACYTTLARQVQLCNLAQPDLQPNRCCNCNLLLIGPSWAHSTKQVPPSRTPTSTHLPALVSPTPQLARRPGRSSPSELLLKEQEVSYDVRAERQHASRTGMQRSQPLCLPV